MTTYLRASLMTCGVLLAGAADAADIRRPEAPPAPAVAPARPWVLQVTPYLWAAGLKGDISPFRRGPTIRVEKPFSEILDDLNVGGFVNLWGRYDRFVASGDVMYVNTTESRSVGALPRIGPTPGLGAEADTTQFTATLQGGYRVHAGERLSLDVLAGARVWQISNGVTIHYGPYSVSHRERFGWVDPVVGLRAFYRVMDKLALLAQGDIGGFGAGSRSTWQALATVNYNVTDTFTASAGYKVLKVDYAAGGHVFDTTLHGPVVGVTYRF